MFLNRSFILLGRCIKRLFCHFGAENGVKTKVILQLSDTECGLAALAIIFTWYHYSISIEKMRSECGSSRDGNKATTLIKTARAHGFIAEAWRMEPEALKCLDYPVIAFWKFRHYVVIDGFRKNNFFINDPAQGSLIVSAETFDRCFTGVVIRIRPGPNMQRGNKTKQFRPFLKEWLSGCSYTFAFTILSMLILTAGSFLYSCLSGLIIDQIIIRDHYEWIPWISLILITSAVLLTVTALMQKWYHFKWYSTAGIVKYSFIIKHLFRLPLIFYSLRQKSEIVSMVSRVEYIIHSVFRHISSCLINLISAGIAFGIMLYLARTLALFGLFFTFIPIVSALIISRIYYDDEKLKTQATGKHYAETVTFLKNIASIKACGLEDIAVKKWQRPFLQKINCEERTNSGTAIQESLGELFHTLPALFILWMGTREASYSHFSAGNLVTFYTLFLFFSGTIQTLIRSLKEISLTFPSHKRIKDIMQCPADVRLMRMSAPDIFTKNALFSLHCRDICFSYNQDRPPVIDHINLSIHHGEHIALVGCTGSGKSTLAHLLCGLYCTSSGEITVMGQEISTLHPRQLAQIFAWVSQDVCLYTGTLYDSMTYGTPHPDPVRLDQAIHDACLEALVAERGLNAIVSEDGSNFSGGERQRIEIARALMQDTPVLILDEATSALDAHTESMLIDNLKHTGKTIIYIAHRLSSIRHCDRIILIENGKIIEQGSHHNLYALNGSYRQLVDSENSTHDQQ